jgi:hypothetical protein
MNIRKHGIDLVDARVVFEAAMFVAVAAKRPRSVAQGDEREDYSSGESTRRCASTWKRTRPEQAMNLLNIALLKVSTPPY